MKNHIFHEFMISLATYSYRYNWILLKIIEPEQKKTRTLHFRLNSEFVALQPKKTPSLDNDNNQIKFKCIMWINENVALYFKSKYWIELFSHGKYKQNARHTPSSSHLLFISLHSATIKFKSAFFAASFFFVSVCHIRLPKTHSFRRALASFGYC